MRGRCESRSTRRGLLQKGFALPIVGLWMRAATASDRPIAIAKTGAAGFLRRRCPAERIAICLPTPKPGHMDHLCFRDKLRRPAAWTFAGLLADAKELWTRENRRRALGAAG